MWIYLQVSYEWHSTVDGRSTDEVVIFDVLGILIWQIHHQVYIFILNQSATKQQQWELKNFNTQNNNLEANARNASKPARFWLHIQSFLHSQFTCKNWFAFVNNSVSWILITWSCRGDAHRSPGHPVGDAHNSVDIPLGLRADQVDIPWGTRAYQVDTQWDMLTHGESPLPRKKLSLWIWRIEKTRQMIPHNNISAPSKILTL